VSHVSESSTIPVVRPEEYLEEVELMCIKYTSMTHSARTLGLMWKGGNIEISRNLSCHIRLLRGLTCFCQQYGMLTTISLWKQVPFKKQVIMDTHLFTQRSQFLCVNPAPYAFHVVPVCYDAVFHGYFIFNSPEFLGFRPMNTSLPKRRP